MCGVAGFVQNDSGAIPVDTRKIISRMTDRMRLRGPDGSGDWSGAKDGWSVGLGHRRLSIIDLDGGKQPLGNETGRVQISFNGEIFNFQSLRPELEKKGHVFKTRSDTEVIVHHYEEYGIEGIRALNGMFAFALWDQDACRLVLARDRAGIKPLYYARLPGGGLAFASELTALIQHPGLALRISEDALTGYFFSDYFHAPESAFEGILKLEPGHVLVWERGKLRDPSPFWSPAFANSEKTETRSVVEMTAELQQLLESSVERQLISDVPVGIFLSGGIDSSVVAALARKKAGKAVRTFSIAFEDEDFDESGYARAVAKHLGTDHCEEMLSEGRMLENLDLALDCLDEPNADPSILPTFFLSKVTASAVKVALGGDGGDELFAGYPTYRAYRYSKYYALLPDAVRRHMIEALISKLPVNLAYQSLEWKAKRFALRWDADLFRRHLRWMSAVDVKRLPEILNATKEPWVLRQRRQKSSDALNTLLGLDFQTYLPGSVLSKVDRASMGNSLEVRPPFLDNDVIDWAFSLPSRFKLRDGTSKFILKEMARGLLPEEVVSRPKKGFGVPLGRWIRGPLKARLERVLKESPVWNLPHLLRPGFGRWAEEHRNGTADHSKGLWALIVLDHWMRREGL
jgi:asparagine synthase (glutamine-hydrolysing)